ncbi:MAG: 4Fe-4S dicluster domain-containing protein [Deinococcota bacterium]
MLEKLFSFIIKASNLQPDYYERRCLAVTRQVGGCDLCEKACPHTAITIKRKVEIDEIDCTGCGLCVQVCPSQALEAKVAYQAGAPIKCSQVKGSAQSVQCLTRLEATDLVRLASGRKTLTLVRNDCADCPVGCADVPESLDKLVDKAHVLAKQLGRDFETKVIQTDHYNSTDNPDAISRRDLLRGGVKSLQRGAADALMPLDLLNPEEEGTPLPSEHNKHYQIIQISKPEPEDVVPWVLPRVAEGCIVCPICTKVCPTDAFSRVFEPAGEGGGKSLWLEPDHCNGCDACVKSCPVKVISMDDQVTWAELSGGSQEVYRKNDKDSSLSQAVSRKPGRLTPSQTSDSSLNPATQATKVSMEIPSDKPSDETTSHAYDVQVDDDAITSDTGDMQSEQSDEARG